MVISLAPTAFLQGIGKGRAVGETNCSRYLMISTVQCLHLGHSKMRLW